MRKFCWYSQKTEPSIFSKGLFADCYQVEALTEQFQVMNSEWKEDFFLKRWSFSNFHKICPIKVPANLLGLRTEGFFIQKPKKLQSRIGLFQY